MVLKLSNSNLLDKASLCLQQGDLELVPWDKEITLELTFLTFHPEPLCPQPAQDGREDSLTAEQRLPHVLISIYHCISQGPADKWKL